MLKGRKRANIRNCPPELVSYINEVLTLYDNVENTRYKDEFYYIYVDSKLYTLNELEIILSISNFALHSHIYKINKFIEEAIKIHQ